ncbi:NYN domain-containing protein [Vogesella sp. GCM10023246]|uniref:NYN domain-containing protein n=1 Tax=Vogesella oryzagri TaxID=3160864 RepID=A0ABV1M1Y6_9NEIS
MELGNHPVERQPRQPVLPVLFCALAMTEEKKKSRVACFVDGFNLYHAIDELRDARNKPLNHLKWVNLWALTERLIQQSNEEVVAVYYFSARATWLPDSVARHDLYLQALGSVGVNLCMGNFKKKKRSCKNCGATWDGHEEKESDVSLALALLNESWKDSFDKAIVMTADTDIVPVIKMVKSQFPGKTIVSAIPERRFGNALELRQNCDSAQRIKQQHIETSLFPEKISIGGGTEVVRPVKYAPPVAPAK